MWLRLVFSLILLLVLPKLEAQNHKEILIIDIMDVREDPEFGTRLLSYICKNSNGNNSLLLPLHYSQDVRKNKDVKGLRGNEWNCYDNKRVLDNWRNFRFRDLMINSSGELIDFIMSVPGVERFLGFSQGQPIDIVICTNKNPYDDRDYENLANKLNLLISNGEGNIRFIYNYIQYSEEKVINYVSESI
jgi:hypothetical protein